MFSFSIVSLLSLFRSYYTLNIRIFQDNLYIKNKAPRKTQGPCVRLESYLNHFKEDHCAVHLPAVILKTVPAGIAVLP